MDPKQVARALEEIAAMLELACENPFKVRAYENGARAILAFSGDLEAAVASRELLKTPGIGAGLFANIETLVRTGSLPFYDELRARFPPSLRECLRIPGLGARKVKQLHDALGIDSLAALETACREGRLAGVKGFGARSAERILNGIALVRSSAGLHRYRRARRRAEEILEFLRSTGLASSVEIAGSLRRKNPIVHNINLVAASREPGRLAEAFRSVTGVAAGEAQGPGVCTSNLSGGPCGPPNPLAETSVRFADGPAADLQVVSEEEFPAALLSFTGSPEHVSQIRERAKELGMELSERGLFRTEGDGARIPCASEAEVYGALGLAYIEPELREGTGEIEAALRAELPVLVSERDLRGVIHVHTTASDGRDSLESMIVAARDAGYSFAAITDHSKTAGYAGGLDEERVIAQREEIRAMRRRFPGFRIFHGTEADILADGSIDYGDEFLRVFDLVVASVHSRFALSREEQTARLVRAVGNPLVSVLGHPTGRLLLSREGIAVDIDAVIDAAADSGCALEINCSPQRLDLDWRHCRRAVAKGVPLSIDPDAHSVAELGLVPLGVGIARKGWVTAAATLNARSAEELVAWLERRRGGSLPG
jgi:DNA polymerase (family 10)